MKTRGHSSTVQATKKLTTFNQMIISFMAVAFLILFSANVTIYLFQPQQSSKSISSDRFRSDDNNNPQLFKHSDKPPSFEDLLKFQHEQLQQQQQHSESTQKTFEFSEEHLAIPSTRTHVEGEDIGHVPEVFGGDAIHEVGNEEAFSTLPVTLLPAFTNEFSEFIFNSLIEIANEKKTKYYLTLQLLSHYNLRPAEAKRLKILKSHRELWQNALNQFHSTKYFPNGKRREKPFIYCRISYPKWNPSTLRWYEAEEMILADFVPNRLSSNPAVNKRIDIMRCPLNETHYETFLGLLGKTADLSSRTSSHSDYHSTYGREAKLLVEIIKEDKPIIHYRIDLHTRATGYLMDFLPKAGISPSLPFALHRDDSSQTKTNVLRHLPASTLPMWPDPEYDSYYQYNLFNFSPKVFLCVPQITKPLSRSNVALFLEFVSHHLTIGIDHIFLPTIWSETSSHYQRLLQLFATYIQEGKVSILSQASNYRNIAFQQDLQEQNRLDITEIPFEFYGILWDKLFLKTLQANTCLYLSKGIADYILYLDIDQFFIPKFPSHSSLSPPIHPSHLVSNVLLNAVYSKELLNYGSDLLLKMKTEEYSWKGGPGWSDQHHHPLCYLTVSSEAILSVKGPKAYDRNWLGVLFHHGTESKHNDSSIQRRIRQDRMIVPTRNIYYTGAYDPGVCRLSWQWNGCHDPDQAFCYDPKSSLNRDQEIIKNDHRFDETVTIADAKRLQSDSEAVIYHYSYYDRRVSASSTASQQDNLYTSYYFVYVYQDLSQRGLALLIDLPDTTPELILGKAKQVNMTILSSKDVTHYDISMENDELPNEQLGEGFVMNNGINSMTDFTVHIPKSEIVALPSFATDLSEIFIHAMIERMMQSYDLSVSVFLLNHQFVHKLSGQLGAMMSGSESASQALNIDAFYRRWKGIQAIHPNVVAYWQEILSKFEETLYDKNQAIRMSKPPKNRPTDVPNKQKFQCRIRNAVSLKDASSSATTANHEGEYVVDAIFVPHYLRDDEEEQLLQIDILRCPLPNSQFLYRTFANNAEKGLQVEILKNDLSILHFIIPWRERSTGLMTFPSQYTYDEWEHRLFHVSEDGDTTIHGHHRHHGHHISSSVLEDDDSEGVRDGEVIQGMNSGDTYGLRIKEEYLLSTVSSIIPVPFSAWEGFIKESGFTDIQKRSKVFLAVLLDENDQHSTIVEFLEYYITVVHVDHIILGSPYAWMSSEMRLLLRLLSPYLTERKVSIISLMDPTFHTSAADAWKMREKSIEENDLLQTNFLLGAILSKEVMLHIFSNICLYYTKGIVELLGILKLSDFYLSSQIPLLQSPAQSQVNYLYELTQEAKKRQKVQDSQICYYEIPSQTLIHAVDDIFIDPMTKKRSFELMGTASTEPLFRFIAASPSASSRGIPRNETIVRVTTEHSNPPMMALLPTNRIYYISTSSAGGKWKNNLRKDRFYGCQLGFPYHGCNDRTNICWSQQQLQDHSEFLGQVVPLYFDTMDIPDQYKVTISASDLFLAHLQKQTLTELETHFDLLTEPFVDTMSWFALPSNHYQSTLSTVISTALLRRNRWLSYFLPESFTSEEVQVMARQYQRQVTEQFTESLAVLKQQQQIANSGEKEEHTVDSTSHPLPRITNDYQTIVIAALWEMTPTKSTGAITIANLVLSSQSSYWSDFTATQPSVEAQKSTNAAAVWKSYECNVLLRNSDTILSTLTSYEELADGVGILRCGLTIPANILSQSRESIRIAKVSLLKPRSLLRSEASRQVLTYDITDRQTGLGLFFPDRRLALNPMEELYHTDYLTAYYQSFHPSPSIWTSYPRNVHPSEQPSINLCYSVPWENILTKQTLALLVESLSHHYELGIHHIFLTIRLYPLPIRSEANRDSGSIPETHKGEEEKRLYLQTLQPFLVKQQLTIFFIESSSEEDQKKSSKGSGATALDTLDHNADPMFKLSCLMTHHFEFIQQYSMTLSYLWSKNQGIELLGFWKIQQLFLIPSIFNGKLWKEHWQHVRQHIRQSNSSSNNLSLLQRRALKATPSYPTVEFLNTKSKDTKPEDIIQPDTSMIHEWLKKVMTLCDGSSSSTVEQYYILHSVAVPSRELTNHLLFHRSTNPLTSLKATNRVNPITTSSNDGKESFSFSTISGFPKEFLGDLYESGPNYYQYYHYYYSSRYFQNQLDDYAGFLQRFYYDSTREENPTIPAFDFGLLLQLSSQSTTSSSDSLSSSFLKFVWHDFLPAGHKGPTEAKEFLSRPQMTMISLEMGELYAYYDYQNVYNLQQIVMKRMMDPMIRANKRRRRRRRRLEDKQQRLAAIRAADLYTKVENQAGEVEEPPEESHEELPIYSTFFNHLISLQQQRTAGQTKPKTTDSTNTFSLRSTNPQIQTEIPAIFAYYQRKDQSFMHRLQFLLFQSPSQLRSNQTIASRKPSVVTLPARREIVVEGSSQLKVQCRNEEIFHPSQDHSLTKSYAEFVRNKVDLDHFFTLHPQDPMVATSTLEIPSRSTEEYYQLLSENRYSKQYYEQLISTLFLQHYDLTFLPTEAAKEINEKVEGEKRQQLRLQRLHYTEFLTVFKTRLHS